MEVAGASSTSGIERGVCELITWGTEFGECDGRIDGDVAFGGELWKGYLGNRTVSDF
jgi:hypothetical protein